MLSTNTVWHGDCLELMKKIPDESVDLVLTDPPYNIAQKNNFHTMGRIDRDYNASLNLKQIYRESSSRIDASGDGSSLVGKCQRVSPSLNEEFNKKSRVYILKI